MRAAHESCWLSIGFYEDEILTCVGMGVEPGMASFLKFGCVGHACSRIEKAEPSVGKNESENEYCGSS